MKVATMNISLPGPMAEFVRTTVERDYGNASEFFRDLVREKIRQQVEADVRLLAAATDGAPAGPTEADIAEILTMQKQVRKEIHARRR
jgi:Arc/MetJ-type ribon-helix-helix transcriptional regulator